MTDAINVFYYIFNKIYNFLFNEAVFVENVSIGWVFITVNIFIMLIVNLLNVPEGDDRHHPRHNAKTERGSN